MNRLIKILIIVFEGIVFYLFNIVNITIPCIFKTYFKIPCPGCGLTRAFREILSLNLLEAFKYNILSIPLFITILFINILIIIDIVKNSNLAFKCYKKILKYYWIFIVLIILSEIINIVHYY